MITRVKWLGDRYNRDGTAHSRALEHGTLLGFVYGPHDTYAMIAWDGDGQGRNRGKIVKVEYQHVIATTNFKWEPTE